MVYSWLIYALLSALMAALVAIFGKIGLQGIDPNVATTIRAIIMAAFLILLILIQGKLTDLPSVFSNTKAITFITLSALAGAMSWLFYFLALNIGKVSQIVPIDRLSIVFAILLAFFFLQEKITLKTGIGASLIIAGAIMIALE